MEEASKGALKLNTLTFQLQKILSEAKSVSNELIDVIETRKNKLIGNITRKLESVHDYKKTYEKNFKSMEEAVKKIMDEETESVKDGSFNTFIQSEMKKKGLREETLENCRKRLNDEIKQKVESNPQVKKTSMAISKSFKEMEPELSAKVSVGTSPWEEDDFGLDKDFTFKDDNLHSYLTKPSWTFRGIGYGTLTSAGKYYKVLVFKYILQYNCFTTILTYTKKRCNLTLIHVVVALWKAKENPLKITSCAIARLKIELKSESYERSRLLEDVYRRQPDPFKCILLA